MGYNMTFRDEEKKRHTVRVAKGSKGYKWEYINTDAFRRQRKVANYTTKRGRKTKRQSCKEDSDDEEWREPYKYRHRLQ